VALVDANDRRTTFAYDAVDRRIQKQLANGNLTTQVYDPAGRMTGLVNAQSDGTPISRFTYTYDNVGNRTGVEQCNGVTTHPTIAWKYDKTYQLTNEQRGDQLAWQSLTADQWAKLTADQWAEMEVAGAGAVCASAQVSTPRSLLSCSPSITTSTSNPRNTSTTSRRASETR